LAARRDITLAAIFAAERACWRETAFVNRWALVRALGRDGLDLRVLPDAFFVTRAFGAARLPADTFLCWRVSLRLSWPSSFGYVSCLMQPA
jgi:hypothetical protein